MLGLSILVMLAVVPELGSHALWHILIPIAPALFVFAPGVWRNVCPVATTTLLPRHLGHPGTKSLSPSAQARFEWIAVTLLLVIVPLRHVVLDANGPLTAAVLSVVAGFAFFTGWTFERKSGWCSGLCPVAPVERLYASRPTVSFYNAHCPTCRGCVEVCPDTTPGLSRTASVSGKGGFTAGTFMVGGFPGFVWGWFQVPGYSGSEGWAHLGQAYGLPLASLAVTLALFLLLRRSLHGSGRDVLARIFAAAAVCTYYWYGLPALVGFGPIPGQGYLVDLRDTLPAWFPVASRVVTTVALAGWLLAPVARLRSWHQRPGLALNGVANPERS